MPETATIRAIASCGSSRAQIVEIEPVDAPPGRPRASVFCLGRDRPASRNTSSPAASSRVRRQRIDQPGEAAEYGARARRRHLLRHDDRGEAVEPRLGQPERHLVHLGANAGKPRVDQAQRLQSLGNIVDRGDPARRRSCPVHCLKVAICECALQPSSVSNEPAGLPLRAEPQRRVASRPCAVGHPQQRMGGAHGWALPAAHRGYRPRALHT